MQRQSAGGRTRAGIFFVGSVLLAVLAAAIVLTIINRTKEAAEKAAQATDTTNVVVALHDLYMGVQITEQDVELVPIPESAIVEGDVFHDLKEVVNRTPRERILASEIIRGERLADKGAGIGLNAIITPGRRAMTVITDTQQAIAGLLQAGNYVDIIVAIKPEDPNAAGAKWVSETILQQVRVLAVGGQMNSPTRPRPEKDATGKDKEKGSKAPSQESQDPKLQAKLKPSITLELLPEEAEKLALAQSQGDLYIALRSDTDNLTLAGDAPATVASLIGLKVQPPAPAAPPPKPDRPAAPKAAPEPEAPKATVISGSGTTEYVIGAGGAEAQSGKKKGKNK